MPDEHTLQSAQPLERTVNVFRGHREIFESLIHLHRERIFNTAGDALLAEQLRVEARLAAQLATQKQANEQAQQAVDEAKREAQLNVGAGLRMALQWKRSCKTASWTARSPFPADGTAVAESPETGSARPDAAPIPQPPGNRECPSPSLFVTRKTRAPPWRRF